MLPFFFQDSPQRIYCIQSNSTSIEVGLIEENFIVFNSNSFLLFNFSMNCKSEKSGLSIVLICISLHYWKDVSVTDGAGL